MSRLLFAVARGARIEMLECPGKWVGTGSVPLDEHNTLFMHRRIHPSDAHLQYGPVSTTLREIEMWELEENDPPSLALHTIIACGLDSSWSSAWYKQDVGERALAILIMAEALADEGL